MKLDVQARLDISPELVEAIRSFPLERIIKHCGASVSASPFDFYVECPECGARIKVRSFSAVTEIEDVFDAVFEWMSNPAAQALAARRQEAIIADNDE
jgi:hypothetical protein